MVDTWLIAFLIRSAKLCSFSRAEPALAIFPMGLLAWALFLRGPAGATFDTSDLAIPLRRYTAFVPITSTQLWDALYHLGADDLTAGDISPEVVARLLEFKMIELDALDLPQLTPYGAKCFTVLTTGNGVVPELKDMAAMEDQQRPGNGQRGE